MGWALYFPIEAFTYPHDALAQQRLAQRMRAADFVGLPRSERFALSTAFRISGYFHVLTALREAFAGVQFQPEHPERYPRFAEDAIGEIRVVARELPRDPAPSEAAGVSHGQQTLDHRRGQARTSSA